MPGLLLKAHKFCRGRARKQAWDPARAEHKRRAKALVRTKAKQSKHARDPARAKHVRRAKVQVRTNAATLGSPLRPTMDAARRRSPLGIPLGPSTGATQRQEQRQAKPIPLGAIADATQRCTCGSHTVSARQILLRLVWPCQSGLFALRMPTRFFYSTRCFLQHQPSCLDN